LADGNGWNIVECVRNAAQRTPEAIAGEIFQMVIRQKTFLGTVQRGFSMNDLATVIFGDAMETGTSERRELFIGAARRAVSFLQNAWEKPLEREENT
jgi:hypothetical protein